VRTRALAISAVLAAVALAGCGGGGSSTSSTTAASVTSTTTTTTSSTTGGRASALEAAHINPSSGEFRNLEPDTREGSPPPPEIAEGDLQKTAKAAGCELRLDLPDEGNRHLTQGEPAPHYKTNPPTSGDHWPIPVADGAYLTTPEASHYVHSLEHGRIEIQYQNSLPEKDQLALKGLFDAAPEGTLLFPNDGMPYEVAATAWTNLIGCERYSPDALAAIAAFRSQFLGKGPEQIPL
jgi:Protein of unknown function (DUF3105)